MTKINQSYKGGARKIEIKNNYPNRKITLKIKRNSKIRIKKT